MARKKSAHNGETKNEKFRRLANIRVNRALRVMNQVGALGGKAYESTDDERERIISVLNDAIADAKNRLDTVSEESTAFEL